MTATAAALEVENNNLASQLKKTTSDLEEVTAQLANQERQALLLVNYPELSGPMNIAATLNS